VQRDGRDVTEAERTVLARWSGGGRCRRRCSTPTGTVTRRRGRSCGGCSPTRSTPPAARSTLNAHYTDAGIAAAVWDTLTAHGFPATAGRVREPGCGAEVFLGLAPEHARRLVGVELDPVTAAVAAALNPRAEIRAESFRDTRLPAGSFDLVTNVPFGATVLHELTTQRTLPADHPARSLHYRLVDTCRRPHPTPPRTDTPTAPTPAPAGGNTAALITRMVPRCRGRGHPAGRPCRSGLLGPV